MIRVFFWGTRGSIVAPGPTTQRYGGNTACVQLVGFENSIPGAATAEDNPHLILDGGTGLAALQSVLLRGACGKGKGTLHLLLSHFHWDHLIGIPFFAPMFFKGNRMFFYGANETNLRASIERLFTSVYSPIKGTGNLSADIHYCELARDGTSNHIDGFTVDVSETNHPTHTAAFRIRYENSDVVYATDHEAGDAEADRKLVTLARGANLLILDAQFSTAQRRERAGYGHSSNLEAVDLALQAGIDTLVMFHHNPEHDDDTLDALEKEAKARAKEKLRVLMARDGMVIDV
jgi:phosphoribosyl 1,2-cyclic phosphodiesterase